MTHGIRRLLTAVVVAVAVAVGVCACGANNQVVPPVIVNLMSIDGTTVEVSVGGSVDLTGDDKTFTDWNAKIADPSIVEFLPGRDDGSAQFNPGLHALQKGSTEVFLTNSSSEASVMFTVTVTPKTSGY
ncbi:hypothetical protein [Luethyella okanaganae]|uniref:MSP domain-containing protein n=1 Tax=Luethyella okanaganae TaxID=69372 RepID=A0ABW1VI41_9MICO